MLRVASCAQGCVEVTGCYQQSFSRPGRVSLSPCPLLCALAELSPGAVPWNLLPEPQHEPSSPGSCDAVASICVMGCAEGR